MSGRWKDRGGAVLGPGRRGEGAAGRVCSVIHVTRAVVAVPPPPVWPAFPHVAAGPRVDGAGSVGGHSVGVVTGTTAAEGVGWGRGLRKEGSSAQAQGLKLLGSH